MGELPIKEAESVLTILRVLSRIVVWQLWDPSILSSAWKLIQRPLFFVKHCPKEGH